MIVYVYDIASGDIVEQHDAVGYTDMQLETEGMTVFHSKQLEYTLNKNEKQALRAKYAYGHPTSEVRIEELEALLTGLVFGGDAV